MIAYLVLHFALHCGCALRCKCRLHCVVCSRVCNLWLLFCCCLFCLRLVVLSVWCIACLVCVSAYLSSVRFVLFSWFTVCGVACFALFACCLGRLHASLHVFVCVLRCCLFLQVR